MTDTALPRYTLEDVEDFLADLDDLPHDQARRAHLVEHYPHIPANFWKRVTPSTVLAMDPEQLVRVIGHPDPVGEQAVHNVLREAA